MGSTVNAVQADYALNIEQFAKAIQDIKNLLTSAEQKMSEVSAKGSGDFSKLTDSAKQNAEALNKIKTAGDEAGKGLKAADPKGFTDKMRDAKSAVGESLSRLGNLKDGLENLKAPFNAIKEGGVSSLADLQAHAGDLSTAISNVIPLGESMMEMFAGAAGPIALVVAAIGAMVYAGIELADQLEDENNQWAKWALVIALPLAPIIAIVAAVKILITHWSEFKELIAPLDDEMARMKETFHELYVIIHDKVVAAFDSIKSALANIMGGSDSPLFSKIKELVSKFGEMSGVEIVLKGVATAFAVVLGILNALVDGAKLFIQLLRDIGDIGDKAFKFDIQGIKAKWDELKDHLDHNMQSMTSNAEGYATRIEDIWKRKVVIKKPETAPDDIEVDVGATPVPPPPPPEPKYRPIWEKWRDQYIDKMGNVVNDSSAGKEIQFSMDVASVVQGVTPALQSVTNLMQSFWQNQATKMKQTFEKQSWMTDIFAQKFSQVLQKEIDDFKAAEQAKVEAAKAALDERMAMLDEEFQKKKEAIQKEFELKKEQDARDRDAKKNQLEKESADRTQALYANDLIDQDFKNLQQLRDKQMQDAIAAAAQETNSKKESDKKSSDTNIAKMTKESNEIQTKMEQEKADKEKLIKKGQALIRWQFENATLQLAKRIQTVQAITQGTQAAAATFGAILSSVSMIPLVGPFIAPPLAIAGQMAVLGQTANAVRMINAQVVLPPAELFLATGGVVRGPGGPVSDSIPARISDGEAIVDAQRTAKMIAFIDSGAGGRGGVSIIIHPGAFQGVGQMDERKMTQFSRIMAQRVERYA